ncbi:hypothetical protein BAE30_08420 [Acidithiobacillus caldus]|uniref:Uncharacterized protein n=1 Tax=Acidithiobacillus caldus TaxID=33059 RepID=A0A1E7YVE3_9PROT|nr:hypothetical protein BAE30_08420 [Acidithiobacillus caldus]
MSSLEDKLSASMQGPRRSGTRTAASDKAAEAAPVKPATTTRASSKAPAKGRVEVEDLNAGGGRSLNPPRIWPD